MITDSQNAKLVSVLQPLYADPDFVGVTDLSVSVTQIPPVPAPEVDQVDIPKA